MTPEEKTEFDIYEKKLWEFGVTLLAPHGLRKYFILEKWAKGPMRYHLSKDWSLAKATLGRGLRWLVENIVPDPEADQ